MNPRKGKVINQGRRLNWACSFILFIQVSSISALELPRWSGDEQQRITSNNLLAEESVLIAKDALTNKEIVDLVDLPLAQLPPPHSDAKPLADSDLDQNHHDSSDYFQGHLEEYFTAAPTDYLIDPLKLLTMPEAMDLKGFLNYHAENSDLDIYVYLFDAKQQMPAMQNMGNLLWSQLPKEGATAAVFYFLGEPSKSQVMIVGDDAAQYGDIRKVLDTAKIKASEKSAPAAQLDAFNVQLSISLYWLENSLAESQTVAGINLQEVAAEGLEEKPSRYAVLFQLVAPYLVYGISFLTVSVIGVFLWMKWQKNRVYQFPIIELPKRLGADYAAGVGDVIAFQNQLLSPARQRAQRPEYFPEI
ncbi:MAG: hypothetical protein ACSHX0_09990 [Akkermansiaceae bacterium]